MEFYENQRIEIVYKNAGVSKMWTVVFVTSQLIVIVDDDGMEHSYKLQLFEESGPLQAIDRTEGS